MKIHYQCSNCGQKFQTSAMIGVPDGMYISGCRAVGDAFYCEECVKTWADRNGKPFDEQYDADKLTIKCDNCSENGSYKCSKCDGEMYFKRLEVEDEPQTERSE